MFTAKRKGCQLQRCSAEIWSAQPFACSVDCSDNATERNRQQACRAPEYNVCRGFPAKALHRRLAQLYMERSALLEEARRLSGLWLLAQLRH